MRKIDVGAGDARRAPSLPSGAVVMPAERDVRNDDGTLVLAILSEVRFVRDSLHEILSRQEGLRIAGVFANCAGLLAALPCERPDMVLMDATLPDWLSVVSSLRDSMPRLLLVVFAISESVEAVLAWAEAGVDGYIPSTAAAGDLHLLIEDIRAGRQACSAQVAAGLLHRVAIVARQRQSQPSPVDSRALTSREFEIVRLIGQGLSNKDIARRLDIGVSTAKSHVHNALLKLQLERRTQLASLMRTQPPR
ncbi:response regulator transcription factor [Variovorax sp. dw_954]|uniref:LuxR C-terminal-related transcriptional regulator n=1 Tax=Variovorax sp. dw_954 TaxID=2720078 RepID=UPI001BD6620D|nr:response regulator transcription factor [Variovorax sp. dw_954]